MGAAQLVAPPAEISMSVPTSGRPSGRHQPGRQRGPVRPRMQEPARWVAPETPPNVSEGIESFRSSVSVGVP